MSKINKDTIDSMCIPNFMESPRGEARQHIRVRALACEKNPDGTWDIIIPACELSIEDSKTISRLFPNLSERAYKLLNQELLLEAME